MPIMKFATKEAIPEELHDGVTETDDGQFEVNVALTSKVTEFRDTNIAVSKERDTLVNVNKEYKAIVGDDVSAFSESLLSLRATQQQVDDGKLSANKDVEEEVKKRTESMRSGYDDQLKANASTIVELKSNVGTLNSAINRNIIGNAVTAAVTSPNSGVHLSAINDLIARAATRFVIEDGTLVSRNGEAIVYGADGTTPQSVSEWLESLKPNNQHLFIAPSGGGAGGGDKKFGGFSKEEYSKLNPRQKLELANANAV